MLSEMLLLNGWTLTADILPEEMEHTEKEASFSLPGEQELGAFADLLGSVMEGDEPQEQPGAPFSLPGMIPDGVSGSACLSRRIEFGRFSGEHAFLEIDHLCGNGSIVLGEKKLLDFAGGSRVRADLADALRLGREQTLSICFDDARGAGVCGAALLRITDDAWIEDAVLSPDAGRQTLEVSVSVCVGKEGAYAVRAALAGTKDHSDVPWREKHVSMDGEGKKTLSFSLSMQAEPFEAGQPYVPPVLKLSLYKYEKNARHGILMDSWTTMTGYAGKQPRAYVPLQQSECADAPDAVIEYAKGLQVHALGTSGPAPDLLCRCAMLEGVAIMAYMPDKTHTAGFPCVYPLSKPQVYGLLSPAAMCWQMCGLVMMPPVPDAQTFDHELMLEAAGRLIDADTPETIERMERLRALQIRLHAEAARQGQYAGALCEPGEWRKPAIADALAAAFSPLHLSAVPMRGAWWTQSVFSATLQAFIPKEMKNGTYAAEALLLSEAGDTIASFRRDVGAQHGPLGVIEGQLPDHACVLTLRMHLLRSGAVVEAQEIPVYVGERGPLEAAFA